MDNSTLNRLYQEMKIELQPFSSSSYLTEEDLSSSLHICDKYIDRLRKGVVRDGFATEEEEIDFFKTHKPRFMHRHYYYAYIMQIENNMPILDPNSIIPYLKKRKKRIHQFYTDNIKFANYLKFNKTSLDHIYFKRSQQFQWESNLHYQNRDPIFCSPKDEILAQLKVHKSLINFINGRIKFVNGAILHLDKTLKWTTSKVSLIELSYGIWSSNSCTGDIAAISNALGTVFNIDTSDCYRIFRDIKERKIEPTKYIKKMDSSLRKYIDTVN